MTGKIKNVNEQKGYGFILCQEDGKEYFFHRSGLVDKNDWERCDRGVEVEFKAVKGDKGPRAEEITILGD